MFRAISSAALRPRRVIHSRGLLPAQHLHRAFSQKPTIVYTMTDEAPALATYSLLPVIEKFVSRADINVRLSDISLAGRILSAFPDKLTEEQRMNDELADLGSLCKTPDANIIKLPNISASIPQLKEAISELQAKGYNLPDFPDSPSTDAEIENRTKYAKVMGSAVNPVLREGNSDRRAAPAVKQYARKFPHSMGAWFPTSKSHVSYMQDGGFFQNELSTTIPKATVARIEFTDEEGNVTVMKEGLALMEGEVLDATFMSKAKLSAFLAEQVKEAKAKGVLFSLHMKATMMKISDPIIFGHAVNAYFAPVFEKHGDVLAKLGVNTRNGFADLLAKIATLPTDQRTSIEATIQECYDNGPELAMVDSHNGITNLHVPNDVIVDASMPAMIRAGGQMWDAADRTQDTKCVIPDASYAGIYETIINFCRMHGAFDPTTMGSVPNVGLMAQKAEEYGSHDKTFEIASKGTMRVIDGEGKTLLEHKVEQGDIYRACQTKDAPIRDWVKLAVNRARSTGNPAVFWLDETRAHDYQVINKVNQYLQEHDTEGLDLRIMTPKVAMRFTLIRAKAGQDTISVTGNVLRDYLTDLFPILELGTSAKMLSIVPLLDGGGLFETGAGGSAPKHVQQYVKEGHLRWDSLGEFLALAVSLEHEGAKGNPKAQVMADALNQATTTMLINNKSPLRKVNQLDNRGSHFYFALYWARALAEQDTDLELKSVFEGVYKQLEESRGAIVADLKSCQGNPQFIGGYYKPDPSILASSMRPSATFNSIIDSM